MPSDPRAQVAPCEAGLLFDPGALRCELTDAKGNAIAQNPVTGSGGRPDENRGTLRTTRRSGRGPTPTCSDAEGFLMWANGQVRGAPLTQRLPEVELITADGRGVPTLAPGSAADRSLSLTPPVTNFNSVPLVIGLT